MSPIEAAAPARPEPFSAVTFLLLASQKRPKQSPPIPVEPGSTTFSIAAVAMAASAALPPACKIVKPACAANGWLVATMPRVAITLLRRERNLASNFMSFSWSGTSLGWHYRWIGYRLRRLISVWPSKQPDLSQRKAQRQSQIAWG